MTKRLAVALAIAVAVNGCGGAGVSPSEPASEARGRHVLIDEPAPDFAGESANEQGEIALARWRGKVVLVDFWTTWCKPCQRAFPRLEDLRVRYASSGLEMVGVSEDDAATSMNVKDFGKRHGATFPLLWDKDKTIADKWHAPSVPAAFVVDKKGVVRFAHFGYHKDEEKEIEAELKSLL